MKKIAQNQGMPPEIHNHFDGLTLKYDYGETTWSNHWADYSGNGATKEHRNNKWMVKGYSIPEFMERIAPYLIHNSQFGRPITEAAGSYVPSIIPMYVAKLSLVPFHAWSTWIEPCQSPQKDTIIEMEKKQWYSDSTDEGNGDWH